jgi:hypothetical protein
MSTVFHGIELDGDEKPAHMRYGLLRLLYRLWGVRANDARVVEWRQRLDSGEFWHQLSHFRKLAGKFDRAAGYVSKSTGAVRGIIN